MDQEAELARVIEDAIRKGFDTPEKLAAFLQERSKPMIHVDVPEPTQRDIDGRHVRLNVLVARPTGSEH